MVENGKPVCGIVMPISDNDSYAAGHWEQVRFVLEEAAREAGCEPKVVWSSDKTGIIQESILHNLWNNDLVICDLSSNNSNVMFELGLRLAFNKPAIIVTDSVRDIPFDLKIISAIAYNRLLLPKDMREFTEELKKRICSTLAACDSGNYTNFLDNYPNVKIVPGKLKDVEQTELQHMSGELNAVKGAVEDLASYIKIENRLFAKKRIGFELSGSGQLLGEQIDEDVWIRFDEQKKELIRRMRLKLEQQFRDNNSQPGDVLDLDTFHDTYPPEELSLAVLELKLMRKIDGKRALTERGHSLIVANPETLKVKKRPKRKE